tara:strand:+ start:680 stop:1273 length:594 start_codon:yes stop_codon:yes gene_type:complete
MTDNTNNTSEQIDVSEVQVNYDYGRQDHGGVVTAHNGVADSLLKNDKLYNSLKGDWSRSEWNASKNIHVTTGRKDGKFFIQREQMNVAAVAKRCQEYRKAAEAGHPDPLAPIMDDGKLGYKWMDLPTVISIEISDRYFGGMPWSAIKHDRTLKAQFYRVVQREYNQFVCYPNGQLPIPVEVPYPAAQGTNKYFQGLH